MVRLRNHGHRYRTSNGDGLAYSYSVFDNLSLFSGWASVTLAPLLAPAAVSDGCTLYDKPHLLVCAVREYDAEFLSTLPPRGRVAVQCVPSLRVPGQLRRPA